MARRLILAFDCAGSALSVALGEGGRPLAARREDRLRGHGERLFGVIGDLLIETGLGYDDIDLIAVTRGPGSFTGLRIGLAAARGLGLAGGQPIVAATTFDLAAAALSEDQKRQHQVVAVIDSKRQELFVEARATEDRPALEPFAAAPDHLDALLPPGPLLLCGDGAAKAAEALRVAGRKIVLPPDAMELDARRLLPLAAAADLEALPPVSPLYLRPPDVTLPNAERSKPGGTRAGSGG